MQQESSLTSISPLDGRYHQHCHELKKIVSEYGLNYYRLIVEIKWLQTLASIPKLQELSPFSEKANNYLNQLIATYDETSANQIKEIEQTTNHDVKAVEYFIKEKLKLNEELTGATEFVHFACTSEDINNLAYGLMLIDIRSKVILPQLNNICKQLDIFINDHAATPMLSRTHGQPASPTTIGKEIANVKARLLRQMRLFEKIEVLGKINGAVGNFNAHQIAYPEIGWGIVAKDFVESLNLVWNPLTTQIEPHDAMAEYFQCLARINTIFIDFCRDIWGYVSLGYFTQKTIASEVGSSVMPHKVNPIDFENAEGNLGLANALFDHFAQKLPTSRWQRDLSDSTVLRNIGVACAYMLIALKAMAKGINKLEVNVPQLTADLEENWEVLSEAIQTVMRRYNLPSPYEKLKELTRGKKVTSHVLRQFIESLALPTHVKQQLMELTPQTYIGLADKLVKDYLI